MTTLGVPCGISSRGISRHVGRCDLSQVVLIRSAAACVRPTSLTLRAHNTSLTSTDRNSIASTMSTNYLSPTTLATNQTVSALVPSLSHPCQGLITPGRLVTLQNVQGLHETNEVHHWDCQTRHQYQQLHWVPIYSHAQLIIYLQTLVLDLDSQKPRCLSGEEVTMSVTVFKDSVNLISIVIRYYFY